jgi:hypothetical protein
MTTSKLDIISRIFRKYDVVKLITYNAAIVLDKTYHVVLIADGKDALFGMDDLENLVQVEQENKDLWVLLRDELSTCFN